LRDVYRDMVMIRAFESMLGDIKTQGAYRGIAYEHAGAAHLSIGQEAAVVGLCLPLTPDDLMFGSHRSHGEILAKCARAIRVLPEADLQRTMEGYLGGDILRVIEPAAQWDSVQELARHFILYGVLAEIFARTTGVNRGLGGSMHAFFAPFGSMPNNAIVGGSAPIAAGAALFKRCNRRPGIVVANIGDAAAGCGPTWEAITFSAMEQYRTLWDQDVGGAPPMLFNFLNNFYGMGGQTAGETMGFEVLARIGAGVNADGLHAERVDGYNPLAVAAAVAAKRELLEAGRGPVVLDTVTYRIAGHSPSDAAEITFHDALQFRLRQHADGARALGQNLAVAAV
jgi:2-oxoisovalerate dehydrogenase E1 component